MRPWRCLVVCVGRSFQTKELYEASQNVPKTPGGKNPYDVLGLTVTKKTTTDDLTKHYRERVVECHPDHGGSHEQMSELNAAHQLVKEHHANVIKRWETVGSSAAKAQHAYSRSSVLRRDKDELGRSGGIPRQQTRDVNQAAERAERPRRTAREVEAAWEGWRRETEAVVIRMTGRYQLAVDQCCFFRMSSMMSEIMVRERWLRKVFMKGVWEEVHEMRSEILRGASRSPQYAQLAEEMVTFAGQMNRKLTDDFARVTQQGVQYQSRLFAARVVLTLIGLHLAARFLTAIGRFYRDNTLTVKLRPAILGY